MRCSYCCIDKTEVFWDVRLCTSKGRQRLAHLHSVTFLKTQILSSTVVRTCRLALDRKMIFLSSAEHIKHIFIYNSEV